MGVSKKTFFAHQCGAYRAPIKFGPLDFIIGELFPSHHERELTPADNDAAR